ECAGVGDGETPRQPTGRRGDGAALIDMPDPVFDTRWLMRCWRILSGLRGGRARHIRQSVINPVA
ncbi:TPA: hypothetical protein ACH9TR_005381, partial [Escherichia coli]